MIKPRSSVLAGLQANEDNKPFAQFIITVDEERNGLLRIKLRNIKKFTDFFYPSG